MTKKPKNQQINLNFCEKSSDYNIIQNVIETQGDFEERKRFPEDLKLINILNEEAEKDAFEELKNNIEGSDDGNAKIEMVVDYNEYDEGIEKIKEIDNYSKKAMEFEEIKAI